MLNEDEITKTDNHQMLAQNFILHLEISMNIDILFR